jgi:iron complex outermembrane receptor protein
MSPRPALLPILILAALPAFAAEPAKRLETVEVATPAAASPGRVEDEAIRAQRSASSDSARLLTRLPGVALQGGGGVSSLPVVNGLADDRLRLQVDGMDLVSACGNHMNPPLSYIDPSLVARIEAWTGAVPVSVGGDAIGAAIRVESPAPRFAEGETLRNEGEVGLFHRSNGNGRGGHVAATLAGANWSLAYAGSRAESGNYFAAADFKPAAVVTDNLPRDGRGIAADEVASSAYDTRNQQATLALRHGRGQWELAAAVQDIPFQGFPNQRMDMTGNDSTRWRLRHVGEYAFGTLEARAYAERTRHSMQFGDDKRYWYHTSLSVPGMPMETEGENRGLDLRVEHERSAQDTLRAGLALQRYRLDDWWPPSGTVGGMQPNTFWNIRDGERDRDEVFAEWDRRWNSHWSSLAGLRIGSVHMAAGEVAGYNTMYAAAATEFNARDRDRVDAHVDATALLRYAPDTATVYEFGYARQGRSPNLYERFAWSTNGMAMRMVNLVGDGNGYVGNLDLEPERADTLSVAAAWRDPDGDRWDLRASAHWRRVDDYIDAERCFTGGGMCTAANVAAGTGFVYLRYVNHDATLAGLDLDGSLALGRLGALGDLRLRGKASVLDGENRDTGDDLYNIMPANVTLALEQRTARFGSTLEWQAVAARDAVSAVRNEVPTAGYGLLHLRGYYDHDWLRIDLGIDNLLDRDYRHPLGGAYVGQGMTMAATAVPWGVRVPGAGRSFNVGVTLRY